MGVCQFTPRPRWLVIVADGRAWHWARRFGPWPVQGSPEPCQSGRGRGPGQPPHTAAARPPARAGGRAAKVSPHTLARVQEGAGEPMAAGLLVFLGPVGGQVHHPVAQLVRGGEADALARAAAVSARSARAARVGGGAGAVKAVVVVQPGHLDAVPFQQFSQGAMASPPMAHSTRSCSAAASASSTPRTTKARGACNAGCAAASGSKQRARLRWRSRWSGICSPIWSWRFCGMRASLRNSRAASCTPSCPEEILRLDGQSLGQLQQPGGIGRRAALLVLAQGLLADVAQPLRERVQAQPSQHTRTADSVMNHRALRG